MTERCMLRERCATCLRQRVRRSSTAGCCSRSQRTTRTTYELILGSEVALAGSGACVHMPRFTPHTFRNAGTEPAEIVELSAPGGIDRYFEAVAHLGPVAMDLEARNDVGRPYGISFPESPEDYLEPPPGREPPPLDHRRRGRGSPLGVGGL